MVIVGESFKDRGVEIKVEARGLAVVLELTWQVDFTNGNHRAVS